MTFLLTFLILLLDFWAIVNIVQSPSATGAKIGWIAAVVLFPFLGLTAWYFLAPKAQPRLFSAN